eukprot:superscaffoldBa00004552_g19076
MVQKHYSVHHAKARSIIEMAFGRMKARRLSIVFKALEVNPTFVPAVITRWAAIHNIYSGIGDIEEPVQEAWRDNTQAPLAAEASCGGGDGVSFQLVTVLDDGRYPPVHEAIRTGGLIDGCDPIASCIRENHCHQAAVISP